MAIRPAEERDLPAVLALNEESVHFLAPLTPKRLAQLHRDASLHWVLEEQGRVAGFVLAFREGLEHDSVNYRWFAERYASFLYVDRVVVSADARGRGSGSRLYEQLFAHALATGVERVTAEFDVDPPNPVSSRFHAKFGFHEVGRQVVPYGMKEVSMQVAEPARKGGGAVDPRVALDSLAWECPAPSVCEKRAVCGDVTLRLVEFSRGFVEPERCSRGHVGYVLEGELDLDIAGRVVRFGPGDGVLIPAGDEYSHRATVVGDVVRLILVEHT